MLNNLSVKNRLTLLVCLLTIFMIALSGIGLFQTSAIKARLKTVYEDRTAVMVQLITIMDNLHRSRGRIISAMVATDTASAAKEVENIPRFLAEHDKQWTAYMATYLTPEEKILAANFEKSYKEFRKAMDVVRPVAAQGDKDKTAEIMSSTDFRKFFNASRDDLNKLTDLQARVAKEEYEGGLADYDAARIEMGLAVGVGLLLAIFIATGIIRSITGPLRAAVEAAQHVAAGNLTHPIRTDVKAEMGQLLAAMHKMQQALTELVGQIQRDATHLSGTAANLANSAEEVARASGLQSDASSSIAASVEEMTVSISHISARTGDTREVSIESGKLSESGAEISGQATDSMRMIAQTVNTASRQIEDLSHKIDRVSGIVNVIKDIADQTNLLALNAAIEAARAGEQGRGFAVVADEVRKLAERTSQSTQEIGNVIGEILTAAAVSVEGMKTSVDQVHQGVKLSEEAGETINRIHDMEIRVVDAVNEIADALREQSVASTDIAQQIERIAQATEENNAAITATAESSQTVSALGKSLLQTVSRFRV